MSSNTDNTPRWIIYVGGLASIATIIATIIAYFALVKPPDSSQSVSVGLATTSPVTKKSTWNVILDRTIHAESYNGYDTSADTHFILVTASFENMTSTRQVLSKKYFDLQDSSNQHYDVDQASNPDHTFSVDSRKTMQLTVAFIVPDDVCKFRLTFIINTVIERTWTITSRYPGCE